MVRKRKKTKRVPKDKKTGLPKKYLGTTKGSKRAELARVLKRISRLAKAGKTIPRSLLKRRIELGRTKKNKKKEPNSKKKKGFKLLPGKKTSKRSY